MGDKAAIKLEMERWVEKDGVVEKKPTLRINLIGDYYNPAIRAIRRGAGFVGSLLEKVEKGQKI